MNTTTILALAAHHHHRHGVAASRSHLAGPDHLMHVLRAAQYVSGALLALAVAGTALAWAIHYHGRYRPEAATVLLLGPASLIGLVAGAVAGLPRLGVAAALWLLIVALASGVRLDIEDRRAGNDRRRRAERRIGVLGLVGALRTTRTVSTAVPSQPEVIVGRTSTRIVKLVRGWDSGRHTGIVGAPGSGKSTTIATLLEQHICGWHELRHGAVIIDPKGDPTIGRAASAAARSVGVELIEFTPQGGVVYDVLAGGDVDRRTDKILAAEQWTEPHYLAGATTYLREVMRTLDATGGHPTLTKVLALMDPDKHENAAATAGPAYAKQLGSYIAGLTPRQRSDLSGLRDRIGALGRSDMAAWLDPDRNPHAPRLDLAQAVDTSSVVLFTLQADDYPMLSKKLAAAIVLDLIAIAQRRQTDPIPTFVAIDEFGAIDSELVLRLLARARGAGFSVTLAAQTLADFAAATADGSMATRVIGNLNALIVGRLNDAAEAEWVAQVAGTKDGWTTTERTNLILPTGEGTRTLTRDFIVHPDQIKTLRRGQAAVIALDAIPRQPRVQITNVRTPRLA